MCCATVLKSVSIADSNAPRVLYTGRTTPFFSPCFLSPGGTLASPTESPSLDNSNDRGTAAAGSSSRRFTSARNTESNRFFTVSDNFPAKEFRREGLWLASFCADEPTTESPFGIRRTKVKAPCTISKDVISAASVTAASVTALDSPWLLSASAFDNESI